MARFLAALVFASSLLLAVTASTEQSHAAAAASEEFWHTALPDTPLPDALRWYLHHDNSSESSSNAVFGDESEAERLSRLWFFYCRFLYAGHHHHSHTPSPAADHDAKTIRILSGAVFFHEEAVKVGQSLPFLFRPGRRATLGMLPRDAADSIPFSTSAIPGVLALLGIAGGRAAADMEETLSMCEAPPLVAGEPKFCATSLEAMVEGAMAALGTRHVRPVTSMLPRSGMPWQRYTIRAVHRPGPAVVSRAASSRFVACHEVAYPYTVYICHDTGLARLYMVELEGTNNLVTVAVICHTDTSKWDPEHLPFKILGTKPGGPPVCHTMPYGHMIWAKNNDDDYRSSA